MRCWNKSLIGVWALAVPASFLGGLVTAAAQEGGVRAPAGRGGAGEADLAFEREAQLTPVEQTAWVEEKHAVVVQTRDYVGRLLATERRADRPDIVRINCLNNKLMEINAQIGTFEDRRGALRDAIGMGDNDRRMHEYRVLVVVYQKVQGLRADAEACIGEGMGYMGAAAVTVIRPDEDIDATRVEVPELFLDRPPHGSGYY